ncbi:hypothetical protein [Enterococcus sp. DIV0098]|uniref:hypothetical protein n=1 Tax=Enterococcus sp. DIV0098 TaxID=2774843 RepID=UPI003F1F1EC1
MSNFLIWYEHKQFREFHLLIEEVLNSLNPKNQPFVGLPKEMKIRCKNDPAAYQRYVNQRVRYIKERETQRSHFIKWCGREVMDQFKQLFPEVDDVQIVSETISGLNQLFLERYESMTIYALEINF